MRISSEENDEIGFETFLISAQTGEKRGSGLSPYELKILQRILLEMFCQYELSSCFRVLPPPETSKNYYETVFK